MKKFLSKLKRDNYGLTLVELIVGLAIFSIVTASAMSIFAPMMRIMIRTNEISEYNTLFDNTAKIIINDLTRATATPRWAVVQIGEPPDEVTVNQLQMTIGFPNAVTYHILDGVLLRNGIPILPEQYYGWTEVTISCVCPDPLHVAFSNACNATCFGAGDARIYHLTITLTDITRSTTVSRTYSVRPLALNQYN